ncbi:LOW QUALITY PROTEIN: hypothetical protein PoB_003673400 [Plakobranchus ocellatus]|uniref:Uncharacterized protein n=1 Tax=Plakobranchus ocellatus TaxID=259542 RepID=A0AAV4AVS8_9GAST|nr:LOW QUALITY PROTEIN: hypothetical protein PoB_003673400 [Plakobranchus ocellatus]
MYFLYVPAAEIAGIITGGVTVVVFAAVIGVLCWRFPACRSRSFWDKNIKRALRKVYGDLKLICPLPGQGTDAEARKLDRRAPTELRAEKCGETGREKEKQDDDVDDNDDDVDDDDDNDEDDDDDYENDDHDDDDDDAAAADDDDDNDDDDGSYELS